MAFRVTIGERNPCREYAVITSLTDRSVCARPLPDLRGLRLSVAGKFVSLNVRSDASAGTTSAAKTSVGPSVMAIMLPLFGKPASVLASVKGSRVAPVWRPPLTDAARDGRTDAGRDGETSFSLREPGNGTLLFLAGRVTMTRQPGRVSLAIRQTVFPSGKPPRCFASGHEKENTPYALACGGLLPIFVRAVRLRSLNG